MHLVEFSYNNSYQASIEMAPFEALYGRQCRSPTCWIESGDRLVLGPDMIKEATEKVDFIRKKLLMPKAVKRAIMTVEGEIWNFKLEILYF